MLEKEINQQPEIIKQLIEREEKNVVQLADTLRGQFDYVVIAARGTSDNAARYAKYIFGAHNQLSVALATPSLFTLYDRPPSLKRALVMGISQSGQSPDIVSVIKEGRQNGRPTIAITNDASSHLAQAAEYVMPLHAGPEKAVAATKTYTSSLASLALFSAALAEDSSRLDQLKQLPGVLQETLDGLQPVMGRVERYRYMTDCAVIGRGYNFATAFEIALKVKELTQVVAEPYSSADFLHGPIAMVRTGFPVMVIAPSGAVFEDMRDLVLKVNKLGAEILMISDNQDLLDMAEIAFPLPPKLPEWLTPIPSVLPGQLMSMTLARVKGLDPDSPKGLKKVTETW
ncbi:MAG: SIS domain-containing protein [Chloroflexota bacterium]